MRKACDNTELAANHLTKLKELKTQVKEVKDDLADESHLHENLEKMGLRRRALLVVLVGNHICYCIFVCSFVNYCVMVCLPLA